MLDADFKYSFKTLFALREKLWRETSSFKGLDLEQARKQGFIALVKAVLKLGKEADRPINELLASFVGMELDAASMNTLVWRLAAGKSWIEYGRVLAPMFGRLEEWFDPWVPLWLESIRYGGTSEAGKQLMSARFRVLKGPFGGLAFTQSMTHNYLVRRLAKMIGFPIHKRVHFGELVKCVLVGHLDLSEVPKVRVDEVGEYVQADRYNSELRQERIKPCPRGHQWLCHECSLGYEGANSCPRATHPATWVQQICPRCDQESWFDPSRKLRTCVVCSTAEARAKINTEG